MRKVINRTELLSLSTKQLCYKKMLLIWIQGGERKPTIQEKRHSLFVCPEAKVLETPAARSQLLSWHFHECKQYERQNTYYQQRPLRWSWQVWEIHSSLLTNVFQVGMEYKAVWSTKCTNVQQQSTGRHFVQSTTGTVHDLFEHQPWIEVRYRKSLPLRPSKRTWVPRMLKKSTASEDRSFSSLLSLLHRFYHFAFASQADYIERLQFFAIL